MSPETRTRARTRNKRFELMDCDEPGRRAALLRDVQRGLGSRPRSLPPSWIYDAGGVELLRKLQRAPTSYLLEAERDLFATRAYALPLYFPREAPRVIEIGVVDAQRTQQVLAPLLADFGAIRYTAVGPSRAAVEGPCRALADTLPELHATAMVGRPEDALRDLRAAQAPVLLLWADAGICDRPRAASLERLRAVGTALRPRDLFVATVDLRKDPRLVQRVYRDRNGVAKQLHLNLLQRINDELGGHFDISAFRHRFSYDEETGELASEIVSRRSQTVRIDALDEELSFDKAETIETLTSTKYSPQEIDVAAHTAELTVHERWYDRDGQACANLIRTPR